MLKYVFLTSSIYSGSTLLSFVLGAHPRIATIGELAGIVGSVAPDNYHCSCGKLMRNCPFWKIVTIRMQKIDKDFSYKNFNTKLISKSGSFIDRLQFSNLRSNKISDFRDFIYNKSPKHHKHAINIAKRNIDLANIILEITKKDVFFDTSKDPKLLIFLKQYLNCEFKVIHLVKDGRGVFDSIKKYSPERSDFKAIMSWKRVNRFANRALRYVDEKNRYLLLYKDFTHNPEDTLDKLCNFIGIKYSSQCINFRNTDHHIIGNTKMRLGNSSRIYYDEKWKKSLSSGQLQLFDFLAGKMNRKYGYF